jgi:hypothetical protein
MNPSALRCSSPVRGTAVEPRGLPSRRRLREWPSRAGAVRHVAGPSDGEASVQDVSTIKVARGMAFHIPGRTLMCDREPSAGPPPNTSVPSSRSHTLWPAAFGFLQCSLRRRDRESNRERILMPNA